MGLLELSQGILAVFAGHALSIGGASRRGSPDFWLWFVDLQGHHWFTSQRLNSAKATSLSKWRCEFALFWNFPGLFLLESLSESQS